MSCMFGVHSIERAAVQCIDPARRIDNCRIRRIKAAAIEPVFEDIYVCLCGVV